VCLGAAASLLRLEREAAELSFWMQSDAMRMQIGRIVRLQQVQAKLGVAWHRRHPTLREDPSLLCVASIHIHASSMGGCRTCTGVRRVPSSCPEVQKPHCPQTRPSERTTPVCIIDGCEC